MNNIANLRVHIAPVGFEVDRVVIPAKNMRADKVWLLIHDNPSEEMIPPSRPHTRHRSFCHGAQTWTVHEQLTPSSLTEGSTLVFESEGTARRVHTYPAYWRDLTDEQLYTLSWGR